MPTHDTPEESQQHDGVTKTERERISSVEAQASTINLGLLYGFQVRDSLRSEGMNDAQIDANKEKNVQRERVAMLRSWDGLKKSSLWRYGEDRKELLQAKRDLQGKVDEKWNQNVDQAIQNRSKAIEAEARWIMDNYTPFRKGAFSAELEIGGFTKKELDGYIQRSMNRISTLTSRADLVNEERRLHDLFDSFRHHRALLNVVKQVMENPETQEFARMSSQLKETQDLLKLEADVDMALESAQKNAEQRERNKDVRRIGDQIDRM